MKFHYMCQLFSHKLHPLQKDDFENAICDLLTNIFFTPAQIFFITRNIHIYFDFFAQ